MRWDVFAWAAFALVLFAAETLAPGAFMLWLGFAAAAVFVAVLLVPGIPLLVQVLVSVYSLPAHSSLLSLGRFLPSLPPASGAAMPCSAVSGTRPFTRYVSPSLS